MESRVFVKQRYKCIARIVFAMLVKPCRSCAHNRHLGSKSPEPVNAAIDIFKTKEHAKLYAAYKPTYPQSAYDKIIEFCKQSGKNTFSKAVDIGCGSGQSTYPLTSHFSHVTGIDVSDSQIVQAKEKYPDIHFRVGPGENLSFLEDSSIDLVTVAQALHWMDQSKFYLEVTWYEAGNTVADPGEGFRGVLRPGGALVIYGYGMSIIHNEEIQRHIDSVVLQRHIERLLGDGTKKALRKQVQYRDITLPFPGGTRCDNLEIKKECSVDEVIGFYESSSAWREHLSKNPCDQTLANLRSLLKRIYPGADADTTVTIRWPIFMLMGHKP